MCDTTMNDAVVRIQLLSFDLIATSRCSFHFPAGTILTGAIDPVIALPDRWTMLIN